MSSGKQAIRHQFNRSAAGMYDIHSRVQRDMADRVARSLDQWKSETDMAGLDILEIGCGTGALTERLAAQWPRASMTALDIAPAMIDAAKQRLQLDKANQEGRIRNQRDPVRFVQADIELWAADAPKDAYDLIVSNACFQWLDHPGQTLGHIQRLLRPGGLLTFATFGPDTFNELHASFHEAYTASGHAPQRHGLSFQSADGWVNHLNEAGFDNIRCEGFIQREIYASPREFLHSVKAMGASTSQADTTRSIGTRRLFADMYKSYEDKFSVQGGIAATYDVLIIQAEASR